MHRLTILFFILAIVPSRFSHATLVEPPFTHKEKPETTLEKSFVIPNEWLDSLYAKETEKLTGTMLSVGTIRSFQRIAYGNFTWAFIVDIDPLVTEFNRLNYNAITSSSTLKEYLAKFPEVYYERFGKYPKGFENRTVITDPLEHFNDSHGFEFDLLFSKHADSDVKPNLKKMYFWNEEAFQQMKLKLKKTNIVLLTDSIADPELIDQISLFLENKRTKLALIDISNILDYVIDAPDWSPSFRGKVRKQFIHLFKKLPLDPKGKVFFTNYSAAFSLKNEKLAKSIPVWHDSPDGFRYFSGNSQDILALLDQNEKPSNTGPKLLLTDRDCRKLLTLQQPRKTKSSGSNIK